MEKLVAAVDTSNCVDLRLFAREEDHTFLKNMVIKFMRKQAKRCFVENKRKILDKLTASDGADLVSLMFK